MIILAFSIINPPYKRKKVAATGYYLMITEDKEWEHGTEVWTWTQAGCAVHPENDDYETTDGYKISVVDGVIDEVTEI